MTTLSDDITPYLLVEIDKPKAITEAIDPNEKISTINGKVTGKQWAVMEAKRISTPNEFNKSTFKSKIAWVNNKNGKQALVVLRDGPEFESFSRQRAAYQFHKNKKAFLST